MQERVFHHPPLAYGERPPYTTEYSAHCKAYYTACLYFCTGDFQNLACACWVLYMDVSPNTTPFLRSAADGGCKGISPFSGCRLPDFVCEGKFGIDENGAGIGSG